MHDATPNPGRVHITEVGPRDGLQNETVLLSTLEKAELVRALVTAGVKEFELTSFVSPRAVPALADAAELVAKLKDIEGVHFSALVPNLRGAERALEAGVDSVVLFVSASESHNAKNVNCSVDQSLASFERVARLLEGSGVELRGAIATCFGCPFEGNVDVAAVGHIASRFAELGARYVSLGDTTGMATPPLVTERILHLRDVAPSLSPTLHFHNTRGIGLANVMQGLALGVDRYESSIGGLGGCPFAPGATGNIASEDLVYLLDEMGIETGIDLDGMIKAAHVATRLMGRPLPAQVSKAGPRLSLSDCSAVATAKG
ncbi:hydroxymethylglutaryl-CoA lyase [Litchfieldella anticariensis FP35 = DSM 16096]|uniref:Hydroxymethylglutaryl-CoA lyase n=1 Tax=Litchfieldella anticariensis (strain DSM 16096 / CECT 5854 / CIP 108499 / LMG 22089 / FP35) TaxID=1121939 RepID=S2KY12_LITA3|nr:hydroxymethylglutaryl-CoA lyase [Halomonas anticariensis]EPC00284.1 hydroxymethylglutaryl-CoA lyase [Halomonas anticariensis FP35 = DSM 16096]